MNYKHKIGDKVITYLGKGVVTRRRTFTDVSFYLVTASSARCHWMPGSGVHACPALIQLAECAE